MRLFSSRWYIGIAAVPAAVGLFALVACNGGGGEGDGDV